MARVKRAVNAHKKRRAILEAASGYRGQRSRLYRKAKEQVTHSLVYNYNDRKKRKGDFRQLWIQRINAAARQNGMTYNRLIQGLKAANVEVDRKILAELAVNDANAFAALVEVAQKALPSDVNAPKAASARADGRVEPTGPAGLRPAGPCVRRVRGAPYPVAPRGPRSPVRRRRTVTRTESRSDMGTPELISPRSPRVTAARRLARRAFRGKERRFIAEGPQAVREAAAHRGRDGEPTLVELFTTVEAAERYADIVDAARAAGARVHHAAAAVLAEVSQTVTPQGLLGVCRFLDSPFEESSRARPTLVAVLAHVRDPGNAGTVLRCADAAGADAVVLTDASVDLYNPKSVRASVGSLFHLPVAVGVPVEQAVQGCATPACASSPPTARATTTSTTNSTRAPWAAPPPGSSATRPGACRRRPGRSPTRSCASRSTERPRA